MPNWICMACDNDIPSDHTCQVGPDPEPRHNHITRDIKKAGAGCPGCDAYHETARSRKKKKKT